MLKSKIWMARLLFLNITVCIMLLLIGYNYTLVDTKYSDGEVESWHDFKDVDQLHVKIDDTTYLVHSNNCVLIDEG